MLISATDKPPRSSRTRSELILQPSYAYPFLRLQVPGVVVVAPGTWSNSGARCASSPVYRACSFPPVAVVGEVR